MAYDIGPRIGIEGEAAFRQAINSLNTSFKTLGTEMTAVTSAFDKNDKSSKALTAQNGVLNKQIDTQKDKLVQLNSGLAQSTEKYGAADKVTQGWQQAVNKATAELNKMDAELKSNNKSIDTQNNNWIKLGKSLDTIGTKMKTVGAGISNVGKTLSIGLTAPIVGAGAAAAKLASDFNESLNKVEVAFKENAQGVEDWSNTTLKSFGLAKGTALDMASGYGDMATSMGLPTSSAAEMSKKLVGLAGDLASFKNIGFDEANTALSSIFTGETESLKKLGIVMTQANLQEYAASQGIKTKILDMTQAEQTQLRYNYVMAKTVNAQGDFIRTGAGTANSTRVLQESLKELGTTLGQNILPVITPIIQKISEVAQAFGKLNPETQKTILVVAGIAAVIGPLVAVIGAIVTAVGMMATVIGAITLPIVIAIAGIGALIAIGVLLYKNWDTVSAFLSSVWNSIATTATNVWNGIGAFFSSIWGSITATVTNTWNGIGTFFVNLWAGITNTIQNVWNGIGQFFSNTWDGIKTIFINIINGIVTFVTTTFSKQINDVYVIFLALERIFIGVWEIIKNIFLGAILLIIDLVTGNFTQLKTDAANIFDSLRTYFSDIWDNIKLIFIRVLDLITTTFTQTWNSIVSIATTVWNGLKDFFVGLWDGITSTATNAWNGLKDGISSIMSSTVSGGINIFNEILDFFRNLPDTLYNLGVNAFDGLKNGISSILSTLGNVISSGFNGAIGFIEGLPGQAFQWGADFIQGLINGITNMIGGIGRAVSSVGDTIRGFLHFSTPDIGPLADYEKWMPDFMSGLAKGIENSKYLVANAVKGLSTDVNLGMNLTPAMAGIGSMTRHGTTSSEGVIIQIINQGTLVGTNGMNEFSNIISQKLAGEYGLITGGTF